jgi:glycosyltransferase involved in cell wall biosynthesis
MKPKLKVSFITTVYNEQDSILDLLSSLAYQTRLPDEVVIVDAGSSDRTVKLINKFKSQHPTLLIRIIRVNKLNRSQGRNIAIQKAKHSIIAVSDAGCTLEPDWLEKITLPIIKGQAQVVAGAYLPQAKNPIQKVASVLSSTIPDQITQDYIPSSRSIAFTKSAWKKVKGYPEHLNTAEDLVFSQRLNKSGYKFIVIPSAIVHWKAPDNLFHIIKSFFNYSMGDGQAGPESPHFYRHLIKLIIALFIIPLFFFRPFFLLLMLSLLLALSIAQSIKLLRSLSNLKTQILFIPISIILKLLTTLGFAIGLSNRYILNRHEQ